MTISLLDGTAHGAWHATPTAAENAPKRTSGAAPSAADTAHDWTRTWMRAQAGHAAARDVATLAAEIGTHPAKVSKT